MFTDPRLRLRSIICPSLSYCGAWLLCYSIGSLGSKYGGDGRKMGVVGEPVVAAVEVTSQIFCNLPEPRLLA